jgi:hypothetical protein
VSPASAVAWCAALGIALSAAPACASDLAPTARRSYAAHIVVATNAYKAPSRRSGIRLRLRTETRWSHGPMSLLVLGDRRDARGRRWLRVRLPTRPNDAGGWIGADVARLSRNPWRLRISTATRTVRVYREGRLLRTLRAVVGKSSTPTPRGDFAIYERARQADPFGFVGPWALHLTAHSDVLDNYGGGPGRVAIHGRSGSSLLDPLGSARSHGCVRVDNAAVRWLARHVRLATPVRIA